MAKNINARIVQKNDSSTNWEKAIGFIPELGEFFLVNDYDCPIVIGDGATPASQLYLHPLFKAISNEKIIALFNE